MNTFYDTENLKKFEQYSIKSSGVFFDSSIKDPVLLTSITKLLDKSNVDRYLLGMKLNLFGSYSTNQVFGAFGNHYQIRGSYERGFEIFSYGLYKEYSEVIRNGIGLIEVIGNPIYPDISKMYALGVEQRIGLQLLQLKRFEHNVEEWEFNAPTNTYWLTELDVTRYCQYDESLQLSKFLERDKELNIICDYAALASYDTILVSIELIYAEGKLKDGVQIW